MKAIVKRDLVLKTDPVTNEQYWSREDVTVYKAEEYDKVNAVLDILKGTITAEDVRKKFGITSINSVYTWIGKYVSQEKIIIFGGTNRRRYGQKKQRRPDPGTQGAAQTGSQRG